MIQLLVLVFVKTQGMLREARFVLNYLKIFLERVFRKGMGWARCGVVSPRAFLEQACSKAMFTLSDE